MQFSDNFYAELIDQAGNRATEVLVDPGSGAAGVEPGPAALDRMIGACARHGADIACCGTCMDARGITEDMLAKGTRRSTLDELADWTVWAEQVITF